MARKRKKLGKWKVSRQSETEVLVKLPAGMKVIGPNPTIEDIVHAVATKMEADSGPISPQCCHGDVAIA